MWLESYCEVIVSPEKRAIPGRKVDWGRDSSRTDKWSNRRTVSRCNICNNTQDIEDNEYSRKILHKDVKLIDHVQKFHFIVVEHNILKSQVETLCLFAFYFST